MNNQANTMQKVKKPVGEWKAELKPRYNSLGSVYCRAINDNVLFNHYGWRHLTRKSSGQRRIVADAQMRLGLFPWVPKVLKHCRSCAEITTRTQVYSGTEAQVMYFELHHVFKSANRNVHVIVVLRKIGNGSVHYWTVRYGKKI